MKNKILKRFVIRKYVSAYTAKEALKKEKKFDADDCWVDEKFYEKTCNELPASIGFSVENIKKYE